MRLILKEALFILLFIIRLHCLRVTHTCLQRIGPGNRAGLQEIQSKIQVENLPFSHGMAAERKNTEHTSSAREQAGEEGN